MHASKESFWQSISLQSCSLSESASHGCDCTINGEQNERLMSANLKSELGQKLKATSFDFRSSVANFSLFLVEL